MEENKKKKETNKKQGSITPVILASVIVVAIVVVVIVIGMHMDDQPTVIQGSVETGDYRVSSKVPGRVLNIAVEAGDTVEAGQTLVVLEAPDVEAKLAQANAAKAAAQAVRQKADNGAQKEQIDAAYQMWQKAIAARDVAQKSYERVNNLFQEGVLAEQKRDEAFAQYQAMVATEQAAKAQYDLARNGARLEDKAAAEAQVQRAQGAVSEVSSYIKETVLTAPQAGVVSEVYPEVGELVGTGAPLLNVTKLNDLWFTFNVREDLLPGLAVGNKVKVYLPAFDKEITVEITRVKDVGSYAVWKATKALDQYDLKTFEVIAKPVNGDAPAGLRAGMSAIIGRVQPSETGWQGFLNKFKRSDKKAKKATKAE